MTAGELFTLPTVKLERSDITINPKIDGYRKPSNYLAHTKLLSRDSVTSYLPGSASFFPEGLQPIPIGNDVNWKQGFEGTAPLFVRNNEWNSWDNGNVNELRMKILNNVRDEIVDVAMILAEISSTATTGGNIMLRIGRSMQAFAKRDIRAFEYLWSGKMPRDSAGKVLRGRYLDRFNRQTAGMYLEWKYGIMPSVYDLQGITKALDMNEKGSLFDNPPLAVARATVKYDVPKRMSLGISEPGGTSSTGELSVLESVTHKARVDYRVDMEGMRGLNRYGLGLTSLLTVPWDKTPFSFVFDMVVPIASLIKAWGALAGVSVVGYCETLYNERELDVGLPQQNGRYPGHIVNVPKLAYDGKMFRMVRTASDTVPMPLPYIRNPAKVGNMATVLSLFTQLRPKGY